MTPAALTNLQLNKVIAIQVRDEWVDIKPGTLVSEANNDRVAYQTYHGVWRHTAIEHIASLSMASDADPPHNPRTDW